MHGNCGENKIVLLKKGSIKRNNKFLVRLHDWILGVFIKSTEKNNTQIDHDHSYILNIGTCLF